MDQDAQHVPQDMKKMILEIVTNVTDGYKMEIVKRAKLLAKNVMAQPMNWIQVSDVQHALMDSTKQLVTYATHATNNAKNVNSLVLYVLDALMVLLQTSKIIVFVMKDTSKLLQVNVYNVQNLVMNVI